MTDGASWVPSEGARRAIEEARKSETTAEQAAYERGFQAGWEARGKQMMTPMPPGSYTLAGCSVCGMKADGPLGYVCPRPDCPTMPRAL